MDRRKFLTNSLLVLPLVSSFPLYASRRKVRFKGKILVNGKPLRSRQQIKINDTVQAIGKDSSVEFSIDQDAFKVSNDATITFQGHKRVSSIDVKAGQMLAAFKKGRPRTIKTMNATMGIRGTAIYLDAKKRQTEFCTCYGKTTVYENDHKKSVKKVSATHHYPLMIKNGKVSKMNPTKPSHTDNELRKLEAMVGRKPAFDM